ncbi:hypothetical protein ACIOJ4_48940, partial [Streptomyces chartreusis]
MEPELVVEVDVDAARDASGRWRHPARWHRARPDLAPHYRLPSTPVAVLHIPWSQGLFESSWLTHRQSSGVS